MAAVPRVGRAGDGTAASPHLQRPHRRPRRPGPDDPRPGTRGPRELARIDGWDPEQVRRTLSGIYAVGGWSLIRAGSPAAARRAARRAVQLAAEADGVRRSAAPTRCLPEVHMGARNFGEASRTAFL